MLDFPIISFFYYADCLDFMLLGLGKQEDWWEKKKGDGFSNLSFFSPVTRRCPRCSI